jgi:MFS family permease
LEGKIQGTHLLNNEDSKSDYFGDYLILCLCGTLIMFSGGLSNPIMPLYAATFTNVLFLIGMVVSSFWAIRIVSEIPIGTISDYTGRKKPIVLGILFGFLGTLLCAIADNIFLIILGQAIRGAGMSAFFCVSLATITEIVPPQSRGKAMGVLQSIEFIGSTLGASLGGYVTGLLGYKGLFWTCTAIASVALALSLRLRTPDKRIEGNPLTILKQSFRKLPSMGNKTMLALCGIIFLTMIKDSGLLMTALPIYAKFYLNMSLTDVSIIMATRSAGMAIGAVSGGWLSDRIGRAKVLTIGLILAALSAFSLSLAGILILLAVLMFIDGVGMGYVQSTTPVSY